LFFKAPVEVIYGTSVNHSIGGTLGLEPTHTTIFSAVINSQFISIILFFTKLAFP
jgi:hypothetical protein